MPIYGSAPPVVLQFGTGSAVWSAETPAVATASLPVALERKEHDVVSLSVELAFAASPGTLKVDLETADTNLDTHYVTKASFETGLNASFVGRIEAMNVIANYARLKLVTRANSVAVTAKFY